ncbi:hypothetical protein F4679DRAFT_552230 [Xylaria curta]|nr:hypothetical protein F4679DRAFT_552230 [Xylaria curta]
MGAKSIYCIMIATCVRFTSVCLPLCYDLNKEHLIFHCASAETLWLLLRLFINKYTYRIWKLFYLILVSTPLLMLC